MDETEAEKDRSLRNEKLKANRTSETEEQRKESLRIRREKCQMSIDCVGGIGPRACSKSFWGG